MRMTSFLALIIFGSLACCSTLAADKVVLGITVSDKADRFNLRYENAPLKTVLADITKRLQANVVVSADYLKQEVTCNMTEVELLPALRAIVDALGYVFGEQLVGSGVYTIRRRTPEEERAASLKRFFDALRKEGFTEDQSMQILLRGLERNN